MIIPVKCSDEDYKYLMQCSRWAADCWNEIVKADKEFYKENNRLMLKSELQAFVKNITPLHAVGNQHVYQKYFIARDAMFRSRKAEHENSKKVKPSFPTMPQKAAIIPNAKPNAAPPFGPKTIAPKVIGTRHRHIVTTPKLEMD